MAYIKSKDIQLFPSAFRGQYSSSEGDIVFNPGSRLTTEYNLTSLSARASRFHQSYVVRYDKTSNDKNIILSILGYHFALKMGEYLSSDFADASNIWVKIKLEGGAEDNTNTQETKPILKPLNGRTILDEGTETGEFFGIELSKTEPSSAPGEYKLHILEKTGGLWDVPAKSYFRMSAKEISDYDDETKSIDEKFKTEDLTVTKINKITITPPSNTSTLTIEDGKTLTVKGSVTLAGTGTATLNKNLTVANTYDIKLEASGASRTLKISGADKEIAGLGTKLTLGSDLATTGTGKTTFAQSSSNITLTLPTTSQTLATIAGPEILTKKTLTTPKISASSGSFTYNIIGSALGANRNVTLPLLTAHDEIVFLNHPQTLTNKTLTSPILTTPNIGVATATSVNGLTLTALSSGFSVAGGQTSKTLTISDSTTLATNDITLGSTKKITAQYAGLTLGASGGKTGDITLQSNDATARTLTLNGNPTIGTLTLSPAPTGFTIAGGTTEKTLIVNETYTLGPACAKGVKDVTTGTAITSSGENLITERAIYYGLPKINNKHDYTSGTAIYAPTFSGDSGQLLVARDDMSPTWVNPKTITVGNATNTSFTNNTAWATISVAPKYTTPSNTTMKPGGSYEIQVNQTGSSIRRPLGIITLPESTNFEIHTYPYVENIYLKIVGNSSGVVLSASDNPVGYTVRYRKIT